MTNNESTTFLRKLMMCKEPTHFYVVVKELR
jgi:hypothetical protein